MNIRVQPFTTPWIQPVKDFNRRLQNAGLDHDLQFPETPAPEFPPQPDRLFFQEYYLATEESPNAVRGTFWLTFEPWRFDGKLLSVSHYRLPISEGIANPAYRSVAKDLMLAALARQPYLYCLGMGGFDRPVTKSLKKQGWHMDAVPFFFHVEKPARFLQEMPALRSSPLRRTAALAAAVSGAGWAGIRAAQALRGRRAPSTANLTTHVFTQFAEWTTRLWDTASPHYRFLAQRDAETLNLRYSAKALQRCLRLAVEHKGTPIGWATVLDTQMENNKYFGNLRVGSIVDAFAHPGDASSVIAAAHRFLAGRGVDLVVANFSHRAWQDACLASGFWETSSNYVFAVSVPLGEIYSPAGAALHAAHLTRADGPGPTRL
ncbi:MAG TPA: hypothetical protein VFQ91_03190 [Bryobacteraceae bacterium]|nr:hypothetical protein [Bryobacteraceae bacterium]